MYNIHSIDYTDWNAVTPNEKSQEDEDENPATEVKDQNLIRKEQNPTAKKTAVEIKTENPIYLLELHRRRMNMKM